jgi:TRAP-type C4-dicarboxylate transport system permease small subunit
MYALVSLVVLAVSKDPVPDPNDVKAGWLGFAVFIALAIAVVILARSMVRHLRTARDNAEAGVFDESDRPARRTLPTTPGEQPQA